MESFCEKGTNNRSVKKKKVNIDKMPNIRQPRSGSLQFWPRKRAKKEIPRRRTLSKSSEYGLLGFAGYKVGMTHLVVIETNKHSHKKGEEISIPVTMIECPPLKIKSVRLYKKINLAMKVVKEIDLYKKDKELSKKLTLSKKPSAFDLAKLSHEYDDVRVLVYTQPRLTGIGKKKPELFELSLGGSVEDKLRFVKENIGKEITLKEIFNDGDLVDLKAVTRGKGFQGPVKRFGISIRHHKSEKSIRNPGSLGPWCAQGHIMWRVAHAGKMGYHLRTEYNKQILKIITEPKDIVFKGGIINYGNVKNPVILIKGSVAGPKKRLIIFQKAIRIKKQPQLPTIQKISLEEKQGN
ncbi:MAG TPA: 50S ribosomal protein L3 [Candidatus Woesearchaeota archaeon]|nr:50S ribosomal protein L3 [Candidatus Woesearchaeota archaeon]